MLDSIKNQLSKVNYADLSHFDETTNTYTIPKYSKPKYDIGKMYIIRVPLNILNIDSSALATNWNNNTCPKSEYLKIYVSKMIGKMLYVDSLGFDINAGKDLPNMWSGYLPSEEITQIAAL